MQINPHTIVSIYYSPFLIKFSSLTISHQPPLRPMRFGRVSIMKCFELLITSSLDIIQLVSFLLACLHFEFITLYLSISSLFTLFKDTTSNVFSAGYITQTKNQKNLQKIISVGKKEFAFTKVNYLVSPKRLGSGITSPRCAAPAVLKPCISSDKSRGVLGPQVSFFSCPEPKLSGVISAVAFNGAITVEKKNAREKYLGRYKSGVKETLSRFFENVYVFAQDFFILRVYTISPDLSIVGENIYAS